MFRSSHVEVRSPNEETSDLQNDGKGGVDGQKGGKRGKKGLPTIRRNSGPTPVARGGSGAKAPALAARPKITN